MWRYSLPIKAQNQRKKRRKTFGRKRAGQDEQDLPDKNGLPLERLAVMENLR